MRSRVQREDIQVRQGALNFIRRSTTSGEIHAPFFAKVIQAYSDRMTCDIEAVDGTPIKNVPVLTKGGLVDGEPYGEMCLPAVDDYVVVGFASFGQRHRVIIGTIFPYLANEFLKDAVNSTNKAFTKKLLVAGKPLEYRRIFKSGTSVHIEEDGSVTIETPEGSYIRIDEAGSEIKIVDTNGNDITMGASSVTINSNLEVLQ